MMLPESKRACWSMPSNSTWMVSMGLSIGTREHSTSRLVSRAFRRSIRRELIHVSSGQGGLESSDEVLGGTCLPHAHKPSYIIGETPKELIPHHPLHHLDCGKDVGLEPLMTRTQHPAFSTTCRRGDEEEVLGTRAAVESALLFRK